MKSHSGTIPIVALDVSTVALARKIVDELSGACRFYKVGNELFTLAGPSFVTELRDRGCDVFLDLKFHDIPNTVAGGVRNAAALGARLITVHATGGRSMLEAAVVAAGETCGILAVTVLTSLSAQDVSSVWGRKEDLDLPAEVERLAGIAASAGVHGVVCSGHEAAGIQARFGTRLATLVPGVRLAGAATNDQTRVVTPREAARAGAKYIVLGRMVTTASDRRAAFLSVADELSRGDEA